MEFLHSLEYLKELKGEILEVPTLHNMFEKTYGRISLFAIEVFLKKKKLIENSRETACRLVPRHDDVALCRAAQRRRRPVEFCGTLT